MSVSKSVSRIRKTGIAAAVTAAAGVLIVSGPAIADAATGATSAASSAEGYGDGGHGGGSSDTAVTGTEATKAGDAVTAKDSSVTVTSVRKDPDGSYDVLGTKAGAQVMYDVSTDLKTVTQNTGGGGHGGDRSGSAEASPSSTGA
jgi:hypothetical protein